MNRNTGLLLLFTMLLLSVSCLKLKQRMNCIMQLSRLSRTGLRRPASSSRALSSRSYRSELFSSTNPATGQAVAVPRIGTYENFVAKWQARGDHYVSFANLNKVAIAI